MESLTDCIFAFAMTLLVINLGLPDSQSVYDDATIKQFLLHQAKLFDDYALSFILLALFWLAHHQLFHFVKQTNRPFLFTNIFVLMFTALIPLSTSIVAHYGHLQIASLVSNTNLFIVGCLFYLSWLYADRHGLLDAGAGRRDIFMGKLRSLLTPAAAIVAALVSIVAPGWSSTVYVAIPLVLLLMRVRDKKRDAGG